MKNKKPLKPFYWQSKKKERILCKEKIKILNSNIDDLNNLVEEIYDEAILMGVDPKQIKEVIEHLFKNIDSSLNNEK